MGSYFNTMYYADPEEGLPGTLMKQTLDTKVDHSGWKFCQITGQATAN